MEKFKVNIETTLNVTEEDIDDIMCTAFEDGIAYWCNKAEVVGEYLGEYASEQIARGGILRLYDIESDEVYTLTRDKLLNGIKLAVEANYCASSSWYIGNILDTSCIDAEIADIIIQLALFNDIIYG